MRRPPLHARHGASTIPVRGHRSLSLLSSLPRLSHLIEVSVAARVPSVEGAYLGNCNTGSGRGVYGDDRTGMSMAEQRTLAGIQSKAAEEARAGMTRSAVVKRGERFRSQLRSTVCSLQSAGDSEAPVVVVASGSRLVTRV